MTTQLQRVNPRRQTDRDGQQPDHHFKNFAKGHRLTQRTISAFLRRDVDESVRARFESLKERG